MSNMKHETIHIEGIGLIDAETGALIEAGGAIPPNVVAESYLAESDVEWALDKLFRLDGEIVAVEARLKAELAAITDNWKPRANRLRRARTALLRWLYPFLQNYAERVLAARNTKADGTQRANPERTLKYPKGSLAFRRRAETGVYVPDGAQAKEEALRWLCQTYTNTVVLALSIALDELTDAQREEIRAVVAGEKTWQAAGWTGPCPLRVELPGDTFTVRTGVDTQQRGTP